MNKFKAPIMYFFITVIAIALLTLLGPEEKSLGANVRIVYLHGAWVLTAEIAFFAAALAGLFGLILHKDIFHAWSAALGRTGILFWVTYLPLSLFAMQSNWNGLFLAEPRFRLAMIFASDVSHAVLKIHKPICSRTPVTANIMARRKRGSARKSPFQLLCMANNESGR